MLNSIVRIVINVSNVGIGQGAGTGTGSGVIWYARVVILGIDLFVLNVIIYRRLNSAGWTFGRRH